MRIKHLLHCIETYVSKEMAREMQEELEERGRRYIPIDEGLPIAYQLLKERCSLDVVMTILKKYMEYEIHRERLTVEQRNEFLEAHPVCEGCLENQPNQMAHMDPNGCLYFQENGFSNVMTEGECVQNANRVRNQRVQAGDESS